jgi:hypothetical protein
MKLPFCVACSAKEDLQHHHLIPRAAGGTDAETNLITLCIKCHDILHNKREHDYNHREQTRAGLAAAKARGVIIGGLRDKGRELQAEAEARAETLRPVFAELTNLSLRALARELNRRKIPTATGRPWSAVTVTKVRQRLARA